jgi:hypothetical protein
MTGSVGLIEKEESKLLAVGEREDSGWSGVSYQRETFVHFTLNQDICSRK